MFSGFYLFALPAGQSAEAADTVFYEASGESLAKLLCRLFEMEYGVDGTKFTYKSATAVPVEQQVFFAESLGWLEVYSEPDRHVYDPPPSEQVHLLAQYAVRAESWAAILKAKNATGDGTASGPASTPAGGAAQNGMPAMSDEDQRNSGLNLLLLLAQAYYAMLENTVSCSCYALDLELNESYLWTVNCITRLLQNHKHLQDFGPKFEPIFPDLYPSTIKDVDWEDMVPWRSRPRAGQPSKRRRSWSV